MQKPKPPDRPVISEAGSLSIGGNIRWFALSLSITAPDLDPDAVTAVLGVAPTRVQRRGIPNVRPDGRPHARIPTFGQWSLRMSPDDTDEWDVAEAVKLLTGRFPADPAIWPRLPADARAELAFGLDIETFNQTFTLAPETARFAADRGLTLSFDIYCSATGEPGSPAEQAGEFIANMKPPG